MTRAGAGGAGGATRSQRHLVQLQMIRKSLSIIDLESQMAEEQVASNSEQELVVEFKPGNLGITAYWDTGIVEYVSAGSQAEAQGVDAGFQFLRVDGRPYSEDVFDFCNSGTKPYEVVFATKDRAGNNMMLAIAPHNSTKELWSRLDKEKHGLHTLELKLACIEKDSRPWRCQDSLTAELFEQTLDEIVDVCLQQKQKPACLDSQDSGSDDRHSCETHHSRQSCETEEAAHDTKNVKVLREAVIGEFDREVIAMQGRIKDLQQQLEHETVNTEAGIVFFEEQIKDLQQQLNDEKVARRAVQRELELLRSAGVTTANVKDLRDELVEEKKACEETRRVLQRELSVLRLNRSPEGKA